MHVRQLPSKRWRWIVQYEGQRRSGTETTKPHAVLAAARVHVELGGDHPGGVDSTVEELLTYWQGEHEDDWSPTYLVDVAHVCANLPRSFLDRDIGSVESAVVASLQRTLRKQGWSAHRIQRARGCVSGAFATAVDYGWVQRNPVTGTHSVKIERADLHIPAHDVVRAILDAAPVNLRLFLWLAANTGARRGELVGLQWRDIDGLTLSIRRAVVQVPGQAPVVRDVKTGAKGHRRLDMDAASPAMLELHRADQAARASDRMLPEPMFVFSPDAGVSPWRPDYPTQAFVALRRQVPGADRVRLHDLRHYVATTMLQDGEPLLDVAGQLGHANPRTTAAVYAHVMPGRGGASANRRAARLTRPPDGGSS